MKKTLCGKILTVFAGVLLIACLITIRQAKAEWIYIGGIWWQWCNVGESCEGSDPEWTYYYQGTCSIYENFCGCEAQFLPPGQLIGNHQDKCGVLSAS